jgi:hypothetical protein
LPCQPLHQGSSRILQVLRLAISLIVSFDIFHEIPRFTCGVYPTVSGWPDGYAFILSFLAPLWTICVSFPQLLYYFIITHN